MTPPQEPRTGGESFAVGDRERAATGDGAVGAPGVPVAATEHEPRTGGGVAVWRNPRPVEHGASESTHYYTDAPAYLVGDREPGTWLPLAEAEALIDPNDPAVRERIIKAVRIALPKVPAFAVGGVADTVIAWLREA